MPAATLALLARLRELQALFIRAVREGDWGAAGPLQAERFRVIDELCAGQASAVLLAELAQVSASDRELLSGLELRRAECAERLGQLRHARRALKAYAT
jgi:hypothetical protein